QLVAPDRLIESLFAASFRFCGVSGLGWCRCETRRRLNSGPLGGYQIAPSIYYDQLSTDRSRGTVKVYTSTL
ncbi:MAG: hypothetical protein KAX26_14645, partial [Anaerolineae bacterium]|nr:hypothetical protein [Anaerolineae bacterium]